MSEGPVRLGHSVSLFFLLNDPASVVVGIDQLAGECLANGDSLASISGTHNPSEGYALLALKVHLDRNLIGGSHHAPTLYLNFWPHILECSKHKLSGIPLA